MLLFIHCAMIRACRVALLITITKCCGVLLHEPKLLFPGLQKSRFRALPLVLNLLLYRPFAGGIRSDVVNPLNGVFSCSAGRCKNVKLLQKQQGAVGASQ